MGLFRHLTFLQETFRQRRFITGTFRHGDFSALWTFRYIEILSPVLGWTLFGTWIFWHGDILADEDFTTGTFWHGDFLAWGLFGSLDVLVDGHSVSMDALGWRIFGTCKFRHGDISTEEHFITGTFWHWDFLALWTFRYMDILSPWTFWE